jgi:hypothetical protein
MACPFIVMSAAKSITSELTTQRGRRLPWVTLTGSGRDMWRPAKTSDAQPRMPDITRDWEWLKTCSNDRHLEWPLQVPFRAARPATFSHRSVQFVRL